MWFYPQEDSITNFITMVDTVRIDITLLSILCFFDPLSYCFHLIFHFLDRLWSHQDPILKLIPTQRRLTQSPIKKLERRHLNGALVTVVISEFYQWKEFFPTLLLVHHVHAQHVFQCLVCSFGLPISLWVIHSTKVKLGSQGLLETSPKSSSKHRSLIGYNPLRHAMQPHNLIDENSSYVRCLICRTHWNKMSTLHQSVDYHKNRVMSPSVSGNPTMKSIEMTSHLNFGIECGCSNPIVCLCSTFTC
jgi:hypothetical protein